MVCKVKQNDNISQSRFNFVGIEQTNQNQLYLLHKHLHNKAMHEIVDNINSSKPSKIHIFTSMPFINHN